MYHFAPSFGAKRYKPRGKVLHAIISSSNKYLGHGKHQQKHLDTSTAKDRKCISRSN